MKTGKKGIIFALDGAIAVSVVLIMLINTTYYFTTTSKESLSQSQVIKRGYDVVAMFDEAGRLDRAIRNIPESSSYVPEDGVDGLLVSDYLPNGYNMTITLHDAFKTPCFNRCTFTNSVMISKKRLDEGGDKYVQINMDTINLASADPRVTMRYTGNKEYEFTKICDVGETCTYTTTERVEGLRNGFPDPFLQITSEDGSEYELNWIRVLDDGAYDLSTNRDIPENQFIGSGERWYSAFDENGHFEGMHKVSFRIWIEGEIFE